MHFAKKIAIIAILCAIFYLLFSYHYIIIDNSVKMLKKSELTLKYTIFNTKGKDIKGIFKIRELWDDGIGDLLLEAGKISEERLELYKEKMEEEEN
ncbi:hypothetical protein ACFL0H_06280 [Thermodesulfobacteriota bacterium]